MKQEIKVGDRVQYELGYKNGDIDRRWEFEQSMIAWYADNPYYRQGYRDGYGKLEKRNPETITDDRIMPRLPKGEGI